MSSEAGAAPPGAVTTPTVTDPRWTGADDALLKDSLQQTGDFDRIARNVKFSVRMNARELEYRWQQLLFDESVATSAAQAMAIAGPPKRVMWTEAEEEVLQREVASPDFKGFLSLIENPTLRSVFHCSRTAKSLEAHYYRMKSRANSAAAVAAAAASDGVEEERDADGGDDREGEAKSESKEAAPRGSGGTVEAGAVGEENFSDVEERLGEEMSAPAVVMDKLSSKAYKKEVQKVERVQQRNTLQAEKEVEREKEKDRDSRTLALVRGRRLRHAMRSKEVVIGRASASEAGTVDVDLWEEGDASKVSRQQAVLKLKKDCEFYIKNISASRPLLVNGRAVAPGKRRRVADGSLIECGHLEMVLEVNKPLIARLKRQLLA